MRAHIVAAATAVSITAVTVVAFVAPSESADAPRSSTNRSVLLATVEDRLLALESRVDDLEDRLDALEDPGGGPTAPPTTTPPTPDPTTPSPSDPDPSTPPPSTTPSTPPTTTPPTTPSTPPTTTPPSTTPPSTTPPSTTPPSTTPPSTTPPTPPPSTPTAPPSTSGFPGAATTGPTGSVAETRGNITVNNDGTVLENLTVTGNITVNADNVTIRNVLVKPGGAYYGILVWGDGARIIDTEVQGSGSTLAGIAAYDDGDFTAERVDVSGTEDGVRLAHNSTLVDSYIHDLRGSLTSHYDAVTADGYRGWRIEHNTILNSHPQTAAVWIGDARYGPSSGILRNNLIAGGGWSIYAGPGTAPGLVVTGNVFSTRYFPRCGYWGAVTGWIDSGNTWSGNVLEGGLLLSP